jgi:hypothetical protein
MLRLKTFVNSLWFHIWSGFPKSSLEQIRDRYQICIVCESYNIKEKICEECGCNISNKKAFLNKLAWADQECPLKKWKRVDK